MRIWRIFEGMGPIASLRSLRAGFSESAMRMVPANNDSITGDTSKKVRERLEIQLNVRCYEVFVRKSVLRCSITG